MQLPRESKMANETSSHEVNMNDMELYTYFVTFSFLKIKDFPPANLNILPDL